MNAGEQIKWVRVVNIYHGATSGSDTPPPVGDSVHEVEGLYAGGGGSVEIRCKGGISVSTKEHLRVVDDTVIYVAIYCWDAETQTWDGLSDA